MRYLFMFSVIALEFQSGKCDNISVKLFNKNLWYPLELVYYNSLIQIICNATRDSQIILENPHNVVIERKTGANLLIYNMTANTSLVLGIYTCVFDGNVKKSFKIPYRFCSNEESPRCPVTECNVTYCVKTEKNETTDSCVYFRSGGRCGLVSYWNNDETYRPCYHVEAFPNHGVPCKILTLELYLPWHQRAPNGFCLTNQDSYIVYVKDLKTTAPSRVSVRRVTLKDGIHYYSLPVGSTILIERLPHEFLYQCKHLEGGVNVTIQWMFESKKFECRYEANDYFTRIVLEKSFFNEKQKINIIDFVISGETVEINDEKYKFQTYGKFLLMPEIKIVTQCKIVSSTQVSITCSITDFDFSSGFPDGCFGIIKWERGGTEITWTKAIENGLSITVQKSNVYQNYTCIAALTYEACEPSGNVNFNITKKESISIKTCGQYVTTTIKSDEVKDDNVENILMVISLVVLALFIILLVSFFVYRCNRRNKLKRIISSSTIGLTLTSASRDERALKSTHDPKTGNLEKISKSLCSSSKPNCRKS